MLEGLVAPLLNRFLGMYIQNFDPTQLRLGIWNGDVKLRNLELRREALDQLRLPIDVVKGHVGSLTLSIPWSNLKGKAVVVAIDDVFLLAAPKEDATYDDDDEQRRRHAVKMEKLDSAEMLKERSPDNLSAEDQQKNQSFTESLVTKIVDNLQVTVKNIHLRYEDTVSTPGHPFALGVTLEEFSAVSTDAGWQPAFINTTAGVTHKLATLGALALYWNTDATLLGSDPAPPNSTGGDDAAVAPLLDRFRDLIVRGDATSPMDHQFLLRPVSGQAKIEISKTGATDQPHIKASLLFDEIGFMLDDDQYRDALMMVDAFHYFLQHQEYKKYQPKGVTPKDDPKAWLNFAVTAVLDEIRERNRRCTVAYCLQSWRDRRRYLELFKKKKKDEALTAEETTDLSSLEWSLPYEDLRFWRSVGRNQLRKENALVKKPSEPATPQTWTSWIWGTKQTEETAGEGGGMTDQQRKELYDTIDWSEKGAIAEAGEIPRETVKLEIEASLQTGSFTLRRDPHGAATQVLSLLFDNFQAKWLQRPDSFLFHMGLAGLRLYDGTTKGTLYPQIIQVKDATAAANKAIQAETQEEIRADEGVHIEDHPFFVLEFEQNPLDRRANSAVLVKLRSMEVIYNPRMIVEVVRFFKPPERHMESIGALMQSAGKTVEGLRQQTRAGLEFALEEHKTIDAKLDLQAPLIIVPSSVVAEQARCVILDAGHISLNSDLIDPATIREVQSKQKRQLSDEDFHRLEGLMYDKFRLTLHATQLLIGPSIAETKTQLAQQDGPKDLHIIDRVNMDFVIETSILPKAPNLTKLRVSGHLPVLHASVSDVKYKSLMKLIDLATPRFADDQTDSRGQGDEGVHRAAEGETGSTGQHRREASNSFRFAAQEHALVLEDEDHEPEHDEHYEEASDGVDDERLQLHQRNFEFKFTVDKLQGSLFKADPDGQHPDRLLVELVAEGFDLDFYLRPYDMIAEVVLHSFAVVDHIESDASPEFKRIISSEGLETDESKDLFAVKFARVNRDSPEFMTAYDAIETNLDVAISTINLVVTRRTLLTLLDFVLMTFTNPDAPSAAPSIEEKDTATEPGGPRPPKTIDSKVAADEGKIRIKIDLTSIVLILNDDGVRLATLSLNAADVGIFLKGKTMRIGTRLGNLSLLDDVNQGAARDSLFRQLITIQGDDLADFSYETFNVDAGEAYPGYDSSIYLRAGSIQVNFVEEPVRKIIGFMVKFGKMQAIFNAARQAAMNRATSLQENAGKMHFDVVIKTPILVFPRLASIDRPQRDLVTAYLGEIYANNRFVPLDDTQDAAIANRLAAGIRNVRLMSHFHYEDEQVEELEMLNDVDVDFHITYLEHRDGLERPDLEVQGSMSDFNLRITQTQMKSLLELSTSVPAAFATDVGAKEAQAVEDLPRHTVDQAHTVVDPTTGEHDGEVVNLGPELDVSARHWTKLDLVFKVKTIGLELIMAQNQIPVTDAEAASLSKFSLNDTNVKLRMVSDGSLESELLIQSFTIRDSRTAEVNKFRKIMSSTNQEVQQFMASVTISGGQDRSLIAIVTIDSPRVIFALDYLFAIQSFFSTALTADASPAATEDLSDIGSPRPEDSDSTESMHSWGQSKRSPLGVPATAHTPDAGADVASGPPPRAMEMAFRINVVGAQVILIANPASVSSEAIVLGTKQVLLSQQHALTLQVSKVGMFLCRMDHFETTRLRILDDFTLQMSMDTRSQALLTTIHIALEPLILRLSLRDILLALQIVNKASELSGRDESTGPGAKTQPVTAGRGSSRASKRASGSVQKSSSLAKATVKTGRSSRDTKGTGATVAAPASGVLKREELEAEIEGMRVVLIGDLHELPLLDLSVRPFAVGVRDWSGAMQADTSIDTFINVYNFSKSAWEPLIEPWQVGFHMAKDQHPDRLSVELYSRKTLEITLTAASIALGLKSARFLSQDDDVLSKPRGVDAPYRMRNHTGFELKVWADAPEQEEPVSATLEDGQEAPWRFEDWEKMRENLSEEGSKGVVGLRLEGSGFDTLERVAVTREGERLYHLRPRKDRVTHRLLVEVTLGPDNVKYITFRSPLLIENMTQIPVEIGVFDAAQGHLLKIEKVPPGEARPAPVGAAFEHSLLFRPDQGFGYAWSSERTHWRDLLQHPTKPITCRGEQRDKTPSFFFQLSANYDRTNPLTKVYPYMRVRLSAPLELQNLLPYDFKYRIYDKSTKRDWANFLRKGGLSPVHVVELSHLLLMSIDMQDTVYKQSEFAIINAQNQDDFRRETSLVVKDEQGLPLNLRLHYYEIPESGGAFRVAVYSPYLILNKTGLDIHVKSKSLLQQARSAAGQGVRTGASDDDRHRAKPYMFSYPSDDRQNRAILKIGDSNWSAPQSFEAIGSTSEVVLPSATKHSEIHIGISVDEGEGKYKLTKVVTLAPRFILKSKIPEEMQVREPGSSRVMTLTPGQLLPLHFLRQTTKKQVCLCFPGLNNPWSSPFNISDLGSVHVKLAKAGAGQRQRLVRVEVLLEHATVFLHLSLETKNWPFSMRNETDVEFTFFQANPHVEDEETEETSSWRPIRYRLPARSIMPYAWDFPAAPTKELIISANGKERHVKLAEIGNLIPMRVPGGTGSSGLREPKIIDLRVAADGPTQTLILSPYRASQSLYQQKSTPSSQTSVSTGFEVRELDTNVTFKAQLRLAGVGVSLINRQLKELAYCTFRDIELKYSDSPLYQTVQSTVKWIQIDNQLYGGIFPLILYPSVVPKTGKEMDVHPILHAQVTRVKDDSYGVLYIKYATVLLQQMTLEIDEDFVFALLDFSRFDGDTAADADQGTLCDEALDLPEPQQDQQGEDMYFELLNIQPAQLDLSFVRTERVNVEDKTSSRNPLMFFLNILTMAIGNINDAPVRLNALMLENARVSLPVLSQHVQSHYSQEFLYQVHKILGSADFLGNPVGLFNNISSGVADIFYEPYQGLVMTDRPQELGLGIAKGATSFVKKSVFGFSDSFSKVTGSISKGLAAATLDKQFQDRRRTTRARNRPKHALYGVTAGANSFVTSVASGVGGLARKPLEGAEREGVAGFLKGVGKGVVGLATKPAIGVFDLASNVSEGIRNTTTVFDAEGLDRVRLTRFVGQDGIVRPYSQREALGQFWLKQLDNGKYFDEEYIAHLELPGEDVVVMLTYNRIMLIKSKRLTTEWDVPLKEIQTISKERTGLSVTLKGGTNGPFIPVANESGRNFLYRQIGVAVMSFNEKSKATE
ncbi:MAG: hypothetical protein M1838_001170 [Thelocarpon superellum]|nr:MAG: hypothetical protein M1838_001170 [Thelocarpon superellum]